MNTTKTTIPKPLVLLILDGWGLSSSWGGNAITMNNPVTINRLWREYPHAILQAFGALQNPFQKVGNSEIGHASISAGRMINQDLAEISFAIQDGSFFKNTTFVSALQKVRQNHRKLHLVGLVSDGAVHSHIDHLIALLKMAHAEGVKNVYVHVILDGQDAAPTTGRDFVRQVEQILNSTGIGKIATVAGRFFAMDRDSHWDRVSLAYLAQVSGKGNFAESADQAIATAYTKGYTDYSMPPTVILANGQPTATVNNDDTVIFLNARADRAQQLTRAYIDKRVFRMLGMFSTERKVAVEFITMTDYHLGKLPLKIAFPHKLVEPNLASILAQEGKKQLRVAESEKKAHVTYFFNCGRDEPYPNENRLIIPSKNVASYDQVPEMSAREITDTVLKKAKDYDFVVVNLANVDMIGHTGNILAAAKAIQTIDESVEQMTTKVLSWGGSAIITADHGNAEQMIRLKRNDEDKTEHTFNPVPFILVDRNVRKNLMQSSIVSDSNMLSDIMAAKNTLADVAPTVLDLMHLQKPSEMTGKSLLPVLE